MNRYVIFALTALFCAPGLAFAQVVINEIAWMGGAVSANHEWIELYNGGGESVDVSGWSLVAEDGSPSVSFSEKCTTAIIGPQGYFILERTSDESVSSVAADCIYTGALSNTGEFLRLRDGSGNAIYSIDVTSGWQAGDNTTKETMQRTATGGWVTATATPKAINAVEEGNNNSNTSHQDTVSAQDTASVNTAYEPKQTIFVDAGPPKQIVLAGADTVFKAIAYGTEGDPIHNARFLWNFGDGNIKDGAAITHAYKYTGEYIVSATGSSGGYSASDRIIVTVIPADIHIDSIGTADDFFVSLVNNTKEEISIGGFVIRAGEKQFTIPERTYLVPNKKLRFSAETTGFTYHTSVALLYPQGTVAFVYQQGEAKEENIKTPAPTASVSAQRPVGVVTNDKNTDVSIINADEGQDSKRVEGVQSAAVAGAVPNYSLMKWVVALAGLLALSLLSLFVLFRKHDQPLNLKNESLNADDFTIIEEKPQV